jgi:hypothetical protein
MTIEKILRECVDVEVNKFINKDSQTSSECTCTCPTDTACKCSCSCPVHTID